MCRPRIEPLEDRCLLAVITEFSNGITSASRPDGITKGPDGNLWFTENASLKIGSITPGGLVTEFTPGLTAGPLGITAGPDNNLWFSENSGVRVTKITTGGTFTQFNGVTTNTTGVIVPTSATAGPDGNLWFVTADLPSGNTSAVFRVTPAGVVTTFTAGITPHSEPSGITAGPDGNLWFTEVASNKIARITPSGTVTEFNAAGSPTGIVTGPDGNLWVTEFNGSAIARVNPSTGQITGTFSTGLTGTGPAAITVGPDGDLWFTEFTTGNKIGRLNPTTGQITEFSVPTAGSQPYGIVLGPDNNLWFTEFTGNKIGRLNTAAVITPSAASISAVEGTAVSSDVATFTNANPQALASDYSATINWGDSTPATAGIVTRDASGTYHVVGTHTYAEAGSDNITVIIQNISSATSVQQASTASVADAPLAAQVVPVFATENTPLTVVPIVTFQDSNPDSLFSDFPLANITIDWGDGSGTSTATAVSATGVAGDSSSYVAFGNHTYAQEGSYDILVTVRDAGGAVIDAFGTALVQNAALTVTGVTPSLTEGTSFNGTVATFTDAGPATPSLPSDYSAVITWGDGITTPGTIAVNPAGPGFVVTGTHTFEEGVFIAGVAITDTASGQTFQTSSVFTVADAALTNAIGIPVSGVESQPLNDIPVAIFTDANPDATPGDYTGTIDWGDGATSPGNFAVVSRTATSTTVQVSGSHTYAVAGAYSIGVMVTDAGGQQISTAAQATVADAPLSSSGASIVGTEGLALTALVATFTDSDPNGVASDYVATIDWGDGTAPTTGTVSLNPANGTTFQVTGTHTYSEEGNDQVTVRISDSTGGATTIANGSARIADAALTATGVDNIPVTVGSAVPDTTVVASFTDANPTAAATDFTASINWGDGTVAAGTVVASSADGFNVTGGHTYTMVGAFSVTIAIADVGGSNATAASTAHVFDAPITIAATPITAVEGLPFTGDVATFTSANPAALAAGFTATVAWGDGAGSVGTITEDASLTFHVAGTHTYPEEGTYTPVVTVLGVTSIATTGFGNQTNLVSDTPGLAAHTDPNLVNPWGLTSSPRGPFWISDNGTGVATLYDGTGVPGSLVVTIPAASGGQGAPTGAVFNAFTASGAFPINGGPAVFLFVTEQGTVAAWNSSLGSPGMVNAVVPIDNSASGAVYKGAALGTIGRNQFLYVTNFNAGTVEVYDSTFAPRTFSPTQFTDPNLPPGFAPFGIENIGGQLYVTYAKQDAARHDDVAGAGNGFIDVFSLDGTFVQRFASNGLLNSPWGLALAPAGFGAFSNDLLVGNFGDGRINAYNATTGALIGPLTVGTTGTPVTISGLWDLSFGNGSATAPTNTLFFTAGLNHEADGLFGSLTAAPAPAPAAVATVVDAPLSVAVGAPISGVEGTPLSSIVATFTDANPNAAVDDFGPVLINWGDGTTSAVRAVAVGASPNGQIFTVSGTHTYSEEGTYTVTVPISDVGGSKTIATTQAVIADAALTAMGVDNIPATIGSAVPDTTVVASFTDANPTAATDFTALINWGDSIVTAGTVVASASAAGGFNVTGGHTYTTLGAFSVTVAIADMGGSTATSASTAHVFDAPITISAVPINAVESFPFSGDVATFTSGNTTATASGFTATIAWGDGASSAGTITEDASRTFHVAGTHTYAEAGTFTPVVTVLGVTSIATTGFGNQTNLVSDTPGLAAHTDPNLINPWGIAFSPTSPLWISDNGTGVATLYNGAGVPSSLVVTIPPPAAGTSPSAPTGMVFNGVSTDFLLNGAGTSAHFIFVTEDGTISGWNSGNSAVLEVDNSASGAVYKGAALGTIAMSQFLYVTNFNAGTVEVYDSTFTPHTFSPTQFTDPNLPAGFAPFGIGNIGGQLYVTYAKQDAALHDDVAGAGTGFIDVFSLDGTFAQRFASDGPLNSPWGLALAPANFGAFSNDLLVGNFGNGRINAYNATTGVPVGPLMVGTTGTPVTINGLWGLSFGNGSATAPTNSLFFTAGLNNEADGLFGSLTAAATPAPLATVADAPLTPELGAPIAGIEGAALPAGTVLATFSDSDPNAVATDYSGTLAWGDGSAAMPFTSANVVATGASPNGHTFAVVTTSALTHIYTEEGTYPLGVTIRDVGGSQTTASTQALIADAPLTPGLGAPVAGTEGAALPAGTVLATFSDGDPNAIATDYSGTLTWGDGTAAMPFTSANIIETGVSPIGPTFIVVTTAALTHTYTEAGTYPLVVTLKDVGGSETTTSTQALIADAPLTATGVANLAITVGTALPETTVVASFTDADPNGTPTDDSATINWGDGTVAAGTVVAGAAGGFNVTGGHTYTALGTFSVTVAIADLGGSKATAASTVLVSDAPITIAATRITAVEGFPFTGDVATFTSANPAALAAGFTATIAWGDGATTAGTITEDASSTFHVAGTHTYEEEGQFNPVVTVRGVTSIVTATPVATVVDAPLSLGLGAPVSGIEGAALPAGTVLATFTDSDPNAIATDYSGTITWGDGSAATPSPSANVVETGASPNGHTFAVVTTAALTHTYAKEGTYPIGLTIEDAGGSQTTANTQATIADAALTAAPIPFTVTERQPFTLAVASFSDANPNGTASNYTALIAWGDGTPASVGTIVPDPGGFAVVGTHTYADSLVNGGSGLFTVTTTINDSGGASVTTTTPATVNDVPIILTGQLNPASDSGASNQDAITNVTRPNFFGDSEPGSTVVLFAQPTNGGTPFQIAQAVTNAGGFWSVNSGQLAQGTYSITAMATDRSGHTTATATILPATHPLEIDTTGPRVAGVTFDRVTGRIKITLEDNLSGLNRSTVVNAANYSLSKLHTRTPGTYLVNVIAGAPGAPASPEPVLLTINKGRRLLGGIYTLTVRSGGIRDVAGNALDGEFSGSFPSGNHSPGGSFVAELNSVHHRVFAPQTVIGQASLAAPPGTSATSVASVQNRASGRKHSVKVAIAHVRPSPAIHDKALSELSGSGPRHRQS